MKDWKFWAIVAAVAGLVYIIVRAEMRKKDSEAEPDPGAESVILDETTVTPVDRPDVSGSISVTPPQGSGIGVDTSRSQAGER